MKKILKLFSVSFILFFINLKISCQAISFLRNYCRINDYVATNSYCDTIRKKIFTGKFYLNKNNEFCYNFTMYKLVLFEKKGDNPEIIGLCDINNSYAQHQSIIPLQLIYYKQKIRIFT